MRIPLIITSALLLPAIIFSGCSPDKVKDLGEPPTASFTISPVAGRTNTYALASSSTDAWGYAWNKGNGAFTKGAALDTAYFALKGTYTIQLRAFGQGGSSIAEQTVTIDVDDIQNNPQFQLLTAHKWVLDNSSATPIIVGTEGNPSQYAPGGPLAPCQVDDVWTFGPDFKVTYAANGGTFNGGNVSPNYNCGADRSFAGIAYTFTPGVPAGSAGIAQLKLTGAPPTNFIGVTDPASNNYRIISITSTLLVLRSGLANETVHQFRFVPE